MSAYERDTHLLHAEKALIMTIREYAADHPQVITMIFIVKLFYAFGCHVDSIKDLLSCSSALDHLIAANKEGETSLMLIVQHNFSDDAGEAMREVILLSDEANRKVLLDKRDPLGETVAHHCVRQDMDGDTRSHLQILIDYGADMWISVRRLIFH